MSDEAPPPKPKPGSLRDRIAAFEKKPDSSAQGPPAPRPKPGGLAWKPRPRSPPPGNRDESESKVISGSGMSASDAKESIGKLSLKERMAALQGQGAFGQPSPPAPPKPSGDKPKWKPPPKVVSPPEDNEGDLVASTSPESVKPPPVRSSTDEALPSPAIEGEGKAEEDEEEAATGDPDPEEEERQRRAAIAARMARLGGARVGMAPPVFGKKPSYKKPEKAETSKEEDVSKADTPAEQAQTTEDSVTSECMFHSSFLNLF
jgi:hypothetical protein